MGSQFHNAAGPLADPALPRKRLLIVEDEPLLLRAYVRALRSQFDVHTAASGREALALLELEAPFDLVLSDLGLDDMDGADLHETLARRNPRLAERMLFCSGGPTSTKLSRFADAMCGRVLYKPLTMHELRAHLSAFGDRFEA